MKTIHALLLAAAALLLPSCCFFEWHMGRATVELSQIQKGVDGEKPVGATTYAPPTWEGKEKGIKPPVYAIEVPEVSYVHRSDLVVTGSIFSGMCSGQNKRDITPTGKTRWLLVTNASGRPASTPASTPAILDERPMEAMVDGRKVKHVPHPILTTSGKLHHTQTQHTVWSLPAYIVATPLFAMDYTLDFVFNTGAWLVFFGGAAADALR